MRQWFAPWPLGRRAVSAVGAAGSGTPTAPTKSDTLIDIDHVTFGYDRSRTDPQRREPDFRRGKVTAILGGSGCGKTTLLRLIAGVHRVNSGRVMFDGEAVNAGDREQLYRLRRRLGMLFQFGALFTDLSVFENVAFPMREHLQLPEELVQDLVMMKLQAVGLRGAARLMPAELSGGLASRVALARAIALIPNSSCTTSRSRGSTRSRGCGGQSDPQAQRLHRRHVTDRVARRAGVLAIADYAFLMSSGGKVVAHGTPTSCASPPTPRCDSSSVASPTARCGSTTPLARWPKI